MQLILGSSSPRRQEIMHYFSLPFEQASPPFDEDSIPFTGDPRSYVLQLARGKGESLRELFSGATILAADTIVFRDGKVYGKPKDEAHQFEMLSELAGNWHTVYTGIHVLQNSRAASAVSETRVQFEALTPDQIRHYQTTINGSDKAGGYAIQDAGSLIVRRIEGCYTNVLGLPVQEVAKALKELDIDIWQ